MVLFFFFFFSCVCVFVSWLVTALASLPLLVLLHNSKLSFCGAVQTNQRCGRNSTSTKQTAAVCSLRHARNVFASSHHLPFFFLHSLCRFMPDAIPTMSMKRIKAQLLALVIPYSVFNGHRQRYALRKPLSRPRSIRSDLNIIITSTQSSRTPSTSRLNALYPHLTIDTEQSNSSRLCLIGTDARADTRVTTLSATPSYLHSLLHSLMPLSNSPEAVIRFLRTVP